MGKNVYRDPRGRHIRVYCTLLDSLAYRCLSWSARALFTDLRATLGPTNNGDISATLSQLKHRGWKSPSTLARALYELQALGFLFRTRGGGVETGSKVCSLYAFCDVDVLDMTKKGIAARKAGHEYQRFKTLSEAEEALRSGVAKFRTDAISRKQAAARRKMTLPNSERDATNAVAKAFSSATQSVGVTSPSLQRLEQRKQGLNGAVARAKHGLATDRAQGTTDEPTATDSVHLYIIATPSGEKRTDCTTSLTNGEHGRPSELKASGNARHGTAGGRVGRKSGDR